MNEETFILMWCNEGLESVINATVEDQKKTWSLLADEPDVSHNIAETLYYMTMRARFNTQRHYEIYTFAADDSMSREDLINQFTACPQDMADLIRERGNKIYSDRQNKKEIVIN